MSDNKKLDLVLATLRKSFGAESIQTLDENIIQDIPVISTGCLSIDKALGVNGFPKGRIVEVFGPESSGKTTLALHVISEAQKEDIICAFVDAEHALDKKYAKNLGVKLESLLVSQPSNGEEALSITEALVRSGEVGLVIVDSVAALTPKAEIEGEMSDQQMGLQARMMSKAMRKLTAAVHKSNCCLVFINQLRDKIGIMFGSPETTTGGKALRFYSSVRIDIRRITSIKIGSDVVGNRTRIKVVKNKVAPPFTECEVDIIYGEGISKYYDLIDLGSELNIINKSGAWYSYNGSNIGQGKENTKNYLVQNPEVFEEIRSLIKEQL